MGNSYSKISPPREQEPQPKASVPNYSRRSDGVEQEEVLVENVFQSMLTLERRRAGTFSKPVCPDAT